MSHYYTRQGQPIDMLTWARLFEDPEYKIIEQTQITEEVRVSTVWLGLNHNWFPGELRIFETMVFGGEHDLWQARYATEEAAREGHADTVGWLTAPRSD
jgi:hypothetical protein